MSTRMPYDPGTCSRGQPRCFVLAAIDDDYLDLAHAFYLVDAWDSADDLGAGLLLVERGKGHQQMERTRSMASCAID